MRVLHCCAYSFPPYRFSFFKASMGLSFFTLLIEYKMTTGQRPCCAKPLPCVYGLWALRCQSRLRVDDLCIKFPFYMSLCGSVIVATASRSSALNSSRSPSVITPSLIIRQMIGRGSSHGDLHSGTASILADALA